MGLPVNAIIEATFQGRLFNQTILNIFHYRVALESTIVDPIAEVTDFLGSFNDPGPTGFRKLFMDCMPNNYTLVAARAQAIRPIRYRAVLNTPAGVVGERDATETANLAAVLTSQSNRSGRREIGGKHFPTGSATDIDAGVLTNDLKAVLTIFRNKWLTQIVTVGGGGVYQPVILHPGTVAPQFSDITAVAIQDTVRVMRRRTVGLGI